MPNVTLHIQGLEGVQRGLQELGRRLGDRVGPALRAEAEIEMTEAKRRTPVLTGVLKGSGHVTGPHKSWRDTWVTLSFGGPAAGYAIYVHENVSAWHRNGQAKFLESVLMESARYFATRVAKRIKLSE